MLSDSDWNAWLSDPDAERVLLVDLAAYDVAAGAETTLYIGSDDFYTGEGDTPEHVQYAGRLTGEPRISRRMSEAFGGATSMTVGDLEIDNSDGELDDWIGHAWDGRDIVLRLGAGDWTIDDFRVIHTGIIDRIELDDVLIRVVMRDFHARLDVPVERDLISSGSDQVEQYVPACWGQVYNISPVLIDESAREYQIHGGQVEDVCQNLYVDGKLNVTITVTKDNAAGTFTLGADPNGQVTIDAQGAKPGATWLTKPGAIIYDILTRDGVLDPGEIDTITLDVLDVQAPYELGIYVAGRANMIDVLDDVLPFGWFWGFDRSGTFTAALLSEPTGTPALVLENIEASGNIVHTLGEAPAWRTKLGYKRNWTPTQTDDREWERRTRRGARRVWNKRTRMYQIDNTTTTAHRDFLENEWREVKAEDASIQTAHLGYLEPEYLPSSISNETDAQTECDRIHALNKVQRIVANVSAFLAPYQIGLGDLVELRDDRYQHDGGVLSRVVELVEYVLSNRIEVTLWR